MRNLLSAFSSISLVLGMVAVAPPSQAATTCDNYLLATASPSPSVAVGGTVTLTVTCYNGSNAVDTTFTGSISATASNMGGSVTVTAPTTVNATAGVATFTVTGSTAGFATIAFAASKTGGGNATVTSILTVTGGGGGGGTSSGTAASTPVEVSLSLDLAASGASCREGSAASGLVGTWLTLPGAPDCTSTTAPSAKLLGWATRADFPVEIAQRQINNGWGTYELFNEEGQMTAVFIPAGGATFVSASTSLHPIWAS